MGTAQDGQSPGGLKYLSEVIIFPSTQRKKGVPRGGGSSYIKATQGRKDHQSTGGDRANKTSSHQQLAREDQAEQHKPQRGRKEKAFGNDLWSIGV